MSTARPSAASLPGAAPHSQSAIDRAARSSMALAAAPSSADSAAGSRPWAMAPTATASSRSSRAAAAAAAVWAPVADDAARRVVTKGDGGGPLAARGCGRGEGGHELPRGSAPSS